MKHINRMAVAGILAGLAAATAIVAQAETTQPVRERVQDKQSDLGQRRVEAQMRASTSAASSTARVRMEERREKLIKEHADRVVRRLTQALERFDNIADRIGSRLDKLATEGASVTDLRTKLAAARAKIADAKTSVSGIQAAVEAVLISSDPKASFEAAREVINGAHEKVKAAHAALVDVVNALKPGSIRATTTPTTTP